MVYLKKTKRGVGAVESESSHPNFYAVVDGRAVFQKPDGAAVIGSFQNSYFPLESSNFRWISARCKLKTKADSSTSVYIVTALYGIRPDGKEELIAEDITSSISTTETVKDIVFDVVASSSTPELAHVSTDGATSGKLYMNLPSRWKNFEEVKIGVPWLTGWNKCSPVLITGSNLGLKTAVWPVATVTVAYRTGMNSDFSDVRFVHPDGKSYLCYDRLSYTSGVSATFNVLIDVTPGYPYVTAILMFYDRAGATDKSSPAAVYQYAGYYFDFEPGVLTGFFTGAGTLAIDPTTPISGGKSVKHTGNGSDSKSNYNIYPHRSGRSSYAVEYDFDFKILNQGTGATSPYFYLWFPQFYNASNFFWVDFNYNGGVTYVRLAYNAGGTGTAISQTAFMTGKVPVGTVYHVRIVFTPGTNNTITVHINGTQYISYSGPIFSGWDPTSFGFGSNIDGVADWDNIKIRYKPLEQPGDGAVNALQLSSALVAPDGTPSLEAMQLIYARPGGTLQNIPVYAYAKERGAAGVNTNIIRENSKGVCRLGYDSIDKYIGFRFKPTVQGDKNCNIEFNSFIYEYEVLR